MADKTQESSEREKIRLHKHMAACGVASRRKCEEMIAAGRVTVNGATVHAPGSMVSPQHDLVRVDGRKVLPPATGLVYYLLHKPPGYIVSASDQWGRKTIYDLLNDIPERVVPVGRLDLDSEGLLLLTNDGELAHRMMHPRYGVEKEYEVYVTGHVGRDTVQRLRDGVEIEGATTRPAVVRLASSKGGETVLSITIREGRKRQVRLMMRAVGCCVRRLRRVREGGISLGSLAPGRFRPLTRTELLGLRKKSTGD